MKSEFNMYESYKMFLENAHIKVGQIIRSSIPDYEWMINYIDAGAIPYFSKLRAIDFGKLNDEYLSTKNPDTYQKIEYFHRHKPGVVIISSSYKSIEDSNYPDEFIKELVKDSRFKNYYLLNVYPNDSNEVYPYKLFVYLRKDINITKE